MNYNYAWVEPPVAMEPSVEPSNRDKVYMDMYTCVSALALFVTFAIIVTRFRLWHTNKFLRTIIKVASNPVNSWINQAIGFVVAYETQNDLYLIWVVILLIAYDNVFTVSNYTLLETAADRKFREQGFLYSCIFTGVFIIIYKGDNKFYRPLLALWSLVVAKFLIRVVSYAFADRAYGIENVNLVAEYMKNEHIQTNPTDTIDPTCMNGYKYLVRGEEKIKPKIEAPTYCPEVKLTPDVVTVERVWSCKEGLLHPSVDKDGGLKDVCLSFALFKLLRRRIYGYSAAEASQPKTRQLIFDGLLSLTKEKGTEGEEADKERVFRVIKMELGFLRDLIFTRYPVAFAFGFPVLNSLILSGTLGVTLWIAVKAFTEHKTNPPGYYLSVNSHNIDYPLTYSLLIIITMMELCEALMYALSGWTKVIMVCQNVKCHSSHAPNSHEAHRWLFVYKVLAFPLRWLNFSQSVKNNLGQYSLLSNCNKHRLRSSRRLYSLISNCRVSKTEVGPPGTNKGKSVKLTREVNEAIFDTLAKRRDDLRSGMAALQWNQVNVGEDLQWTLNLGTPVHTIMVWHVATSFCAIHAVHMSKEPKTSKQIVATRLSKYCAYLVVFLPDLLPLNSNLVKYIFRKIVDETSEFFGKERDKKKKCETMKNCRDGSKKIIDQGAKLGRQLIKDIPDYVRRWEIMADFWSELIVYLAPAGSTLVHMEQLSYGSEFITHLWALLYHAGIIDTSNAEYHP